jgi:LysM repeat protein
LKKIYTLLLTVSLATVTVKASTHTVKHTVKKGETLSGIAQKHHTSIKKLRQANGIKKGGVLKYGKVLKVPTSTYTAKAKIPAASTKYVIKRGDTLSGIARKHHTTVVKVRNANGLKKNELIKIGQVLKVPQNKKVIRYTKTKKSSSKKLVASLSNLDKISLERGKVEKRNTFSFTDVFESKKDVNDDKCQRITSLAKTKLGKRYVWGSCSQNLENMSKEMNYKRETLFSLILLKDVRDM